MDNYGTRKAICQMLFYLSCQQGVPENQLKKMGKKKEGINVFSKMKGKWPAGTWQNA